MIIERDDFDVVCLNGKKKSFIGFHDLLDSVQAIAKYNMDIEFTGIVVVITGANSRASERELSPLTLESSQMVLLVGIQSLGQGPENDAFRSMQPPSFSILIC